MKTPFGESATKEQIQFWKKVKVEITDQCWLWRRCKCRHGYGKIKKNGKMKSAHRVVYELHFGPIPAGLIVRHKCDVRHCVNPDHLELGTHADNARDRVERGRGYSVLSEDQVLKIKSMLCEGMMHKLIAHKFGVSRNTISKISRRETWKRIPSPCR